MNYKVKLEIELKQDTLDRIDKLCKFGLVKNQLNDDLVLSETYEEFIKSGIDYYLFRLENIMSYTLDRKSINLKSKSKIKNNLRKYLEMEGLRQRDLAEITNMDQSNLSLILSNKTQPTMDNFLRIWVVLGCPPIEEIFYRDNG